jgi:hypothetical protein
MTAKQTGIARSLRISGVLLILGLIVEAISLVWGKPLSFLLFACIGVLLMFAGIVSYLYSLVPSSTASKSNSTTTLN